MNKEIKEILEELKWYRKIGKKDIYYPEYVLSNKKSFILLDYITNLQKKSEILEKNNKLLIQQKSRMYNDLDQITDRIDKAIEYINKHPVNACHNLLNILQGDNNEY